MAKKNKYSGVKAIAEKTRKLAKPEPPILVRSPGGTARREEELRSLHIPDAWQMMMFLERLLEPSNDLPANWAETPPSIEIDVFAARDLKKMLDDLWSLAHDLKRHAIMLHEIVDPLATDEVAKSFAADRIASLVAFRNGQVNSVGKPSVSK